MPVADIDELAGTLWRPRERRAPFLRLAFGAFEHGREVELAIEIRIRNCGQEPERIRMQRAEEAVTA